MPLDAPAARTRSCPFCRGTVSEDLFLHGGNCPHCMLEIPGEEAPTDPGAAMRAKLQGEERKAADRARKRRIVVLALAGCMSVVAAVGGLKWWELREAELTYDLPDEYYQPTPVELQAEVPPSAVTPPKGVGTPTAPKLPGTKKDVLGPDAVIASGPSKPEGASSQDLAMPGKVTPRTPTADAGAPVITMGGGSGAGTGLEVKVEGGIGNILTEDDEILAMVKDVVGKYKPQLDSCFRMRLNAAPDLRGSWTVSFTVTPLGSSSKVTVQAVDKADREFESCVTRSVSTWKFQKIEHPFNVRKKYTFVGAE